MRSPKIDVSYFAAGIFAHLCADQSATSSALHDLHALLRQLVSRTQCLSTSNLHSLYRRKWCSRGRRPTSKWSPIARSFPSFRSSIASNGRPSSCGPFGPFITCAPKTVRSSLSSLSSQTNNNSLLSPVSQTLRRDVGGGEGRAHHSRDCRTAEQLFGRRRRPQRRRQLLSSSARVVSKHFGSDSQRKTFYLFPFLVICCVSKYLFLIMFFANKSKVVYISYLLSHVRQNMGKNESFLTRFLLFSALFGSLLVILWLLFESLKT
jgi:hypothetical protein